MANTKDCLKLLLLNLKDSFVSWSPHPRSRVVVSNGSAPRTFTNLGSLE